MSSSPNHNPYVFDQENAIRTWRQFLSRDTALSKDDLDELEDYLRTELESPRNRGVSDEERFRLAVARIGDVSIIKNQYQNVFWVKQLERGLFANLKAALQLGKSYVKTAWKQISRNKGYASLHFFGLSISLAACILIVLFAKHELSYDTYYSNADNAYRLEMMMPEEGDPNWHWAASFWPIAPALKGTIPEIETITRVSSVREPLVQNGTTRFYEKDMVLVEPDFFQIFDLRIIAGTNQGFDSPNTLVLSKSMADKYFPAGDAIGSTLQIGERTADLLQDYQITGIFEDLPSNVHFSMNFVGSFSSQEQPDAENEWYRLAFTYLTLNPNATPEAVLPKIDAFWTSFVRDGGARQDIQPWLEPITNIHLYGQADNDIEPQSDIKYVLLFVLVAALLLFVACINYMNLAIAKFTTRAREVGVRKVLGANRQHLVIQFLGESVLYTSISFVLSIGLVALILPSFNTIMELDLGLGRNFLTIVSLFVPAIILVGLFAGSYPAVFLSRFTPTSIFQNALGVGRKATMRKALLLFQFVVASCLIVGTIIISKQLTFASEEKIENQGEQLLILYTRGVFSSYPSSFRSALEEIPGVQAVSFSQSFPSKPYGITGFRAEHVENYEGPWLMFEHIHVDTAFVNTLGLELVAGQGFSAVSEGDPKRRVLINETAASTIGWADPIGQHIGIDEREMEVVGVVKDYHTQAMFEPIAPLIIEQGTSTSYVGLRITTNSLTETIERVQGAWATFVPSRPFEYSFLSDDFKALYRKETKLRNLFSAFSFLTIVIAILGLLGLVSFSGQQRIKEIGVRKSLGASASDITYLLAKEYIVLVLFSFLVSAPLMYYAMTEWLSQFAYAIDLGVGHFVLSGGILMVVSALTVGLQALKSALISPVSCLRN